MPEFHKLGVGLFVFFSILSLVLVVSKPVAKELEATVLSWIHAFRRIQAEWRKPIEIEPPPPSPKSLGHNRSKRKPR